MNNSAYPNHPPSPEGQDSVSGQRRPPSNHKEPPMTFFTFLSKFPTEEAAVDYFIKIRYGGVLTCPHCKATSKIYRYHERLKVFHCKNCNNDFSPFKGTIFEKSTTELRKWFYAIHLFLHSRKGFPALQLQREIGTTYKTAWRMFHQIRLAMQNGELKPFEGVWTRLSSEGNLESTLPSSTIRLLTRKQRN